MVNITMLAANRPRLLKQALDSIGDLSDATVAIREQHMNLEVHQTAYKWTHTKSRHHNTHLRVCSNKVGTGPARNDVINWSQEHFGQGDYLYLSDDDVCFLEGNWLKILTAAYAQARDHGFRVLAAYNHPFNRPCAPTTRLECRWNVDEVYAVATQSMLMRWDVWNEFGPFCDTPAGKVCQSEDVEMCNRIRAAGYKVGVISPPLLVNTGITNSFGEKIVGWELVKSQAPEGVIVQ